MHLQQEVSNSEVVYAHEWGNGVQAVRMGQELAVEGVMQALRQEEYAEVSQGQVSSQVDDP